MTKKDFQLVADAVKAAKTELEGAGNYLAREQEVAELACERVAGKLADMLEAGHPRFNRALFLAACETDAEKDAHRAEILEKLGMSSD